MSEKKELMSKNMKLLIYALIGAGIAGVTLISFMIPGDILSLLQLGLGITVAILFVILVFAKIRYDKVMGDSNALKDTMLAINPYSIYMVFGVCYTLLQALLQVPTSPGDPGAYSAEDLGMAILGVLTGLGGLFGAIILCVYGILYYAMPGLGILTGTVDSRELGGSDRAFAIRAYAKQGIKDVAVGLFFIYASLSIVAWFGNLAVGNF